jgi:hypothetical protein
VKIAPFDVELNSASNSSGFRNNRSSIANLDSKYLENSQGKPVFWVQVVRFVA